MLRLNLNDGFHKNSNNEKIRGNRINIFLKNEFIQKADGVTHMKAYPLPYKIFEDSSDFVKQLFTLLGIYKTTHNDNIKIEIQSSHELVILCMTTQLNLLAKTILITLQTESKFIPLENETIEFYSPIVDYFGDSISVKYIFS